MLNPEESSTLLDSTMDVLEGNITVETPQSGISVIDQWLTQLQQADNAREISDTLSSVRNQLNGGELKAQELSQLLETLATQTSEFSTKMGSEGDAAVRLEGLSAALKALAGQLSNA